MIHRYNIKGKKVWVAGHRGMVGSALLRRLAKEDCELLTVDRIKLDLRDQRSVQAWMKENRPQVVLVAAAKVGGIRANDRYPVDFLLENLVLETNIIDAAHAIDAEKLVFLGSSCIYPKLAPQPIAEQSLLTAPLEPTNEWYAIAKIAGIKLCQAYRKQYGRNFISGMPTNLYGPGDNFDLDSSHVVPALMRKAHEAKISGSQTVSVWGSGRPLREFLHVDDCADAIIHLLKHYDGYEHVNIGFGEDMSIHDLATLICRVVGFPGEIIYDASRPDGTPRKLLNSDKLRAMGWRPTIGLEDGLRQTYRWFLDNQENIQRRTL